MSSTSTPTPTSFAATIISEQARQPNEQLGHICGEVAAILRRAWGRGPVHTTARWAGRDMLVVVLQDGHTESERTLRAAGQRDEVLTGRRRLHEILEQELKSSVERQTGRHVETMLAATRLDPDISAQIFLLASTGAPATTIASTPSPSTPHRDALHAHELTR